MNLKDIEKKARKMKAAELSREDVQAWLSAQSDNGYDATEAHTLVDAIFKESSSEVTLKNFNLTDAGNADHFLSLYKDKLRYDHRRGRWLEWHAHHWRVDNDGQVMRLVLKADRERYISAFDVADEDRKTKLVKWALQSEQRARLEATIAIAQKLKPLADSGEGWDMNSYLFCVANGVVDLRTGELRPGNPGDMITMQSPVVYDKEAKCPRWLEFMDQVTGGNAELQTYLKRGVGYSMTGETKSQLWFFLYGLGSNGKTTFTMTIRRLMGDYGVRLGSDDLMIKDRKASGSSPKEGVADTMGKRYAVASEVQDGKKLDIGLLKDMSGQDTIKARRLYEHEIEFLPTHKLWMFGNHKPIISDTTHAAWRRLKLIPFTFTIPEDQIDLELQPKLEVELPGILNWAIDCCLEWQRKGFNEPKVITDAVAAYRKESDSLADFIEDCCKIELKVIEPKTEIIKATLKAKYESWCEKNKVEPLNRNDFKQKLMEKGITDGRRKSVRFWVGIRLKTDDEITKENEEGDGDKSSEDDKTLGNSEAKMTELRQIPKSLFMKEDFEKSPGKIEKLCHFVTGDNGDKTPDCPVCRKNEWSMTPDGEWICPCGYKAGKLWQQQLKK